MTVLSTTLVVLVLAMLVWLGWSPVGLSASNHLADDSLSDTQESQVFRLGVIPERDIFAQRLRYHALADYLSSELGVPMLLVTPNTYRGVLDDLAHGRIDGAFMGSMVAKLAQDNLDARVLVKPELAGGVTTYRGVVFVREGSPIVSPGDLSGSSIAMVRTTTAGHLYPMYILKKHDLLSSDQPPKARWVGTHDQVILAVFDGQVDAGAAKDLRIDAFEQAHAGYRFRRISVGQAVPNNALLVRSDLDTELASRLEQALLAMDQSKPGRDALAAFGATRFAPCDSREYRTIDEMTRDLGPGWEQVGSPGVEHTASATEPMSIVDDPLTRP